MLGNVPPALADANVASSAASSSAASSPVSDSESASVDARHASKYRAPSAASSATSAASCLVCACRQYHVRKNEKTLHITTKTYPGSAVVDSEITALFGAMPSAASAAEIGVWLSDSRH